MSDNTFTIGAVVNVGQLAAGMNAGAEIVQEALDKMLVAFSEASPATARAVSKITEDTRVMATNVSEEWQRAARASLVYSAALKEVSAATYLARKAGEDDAAAMNLLAAAKQKAAAASAELALAEKEVAGEAEAEALSMSELGASIKETLGGTLSSILGIGIGAEMFGHLATEAADFNTEMYRLNLTTHISATTLAGLHDLIKEMGGDWDSVSMGLSKMLKAQQDAIDGQKKQIDGFRMVGISVKELKSLTPEELLFRVAQGFQSVGSAAEKNTAAIDIFGRGGRALIPVFESAGAQFRAMVEEEAKASGITQESIAASLKWKEQTEELSVSLRGIAQDALPILIKAMAGFAAGAVAIGASIDAVFIEVRSTIVSSIQGIEGFGKMMKDVATGNFGALVSDAKNTTALVADTWTDGAREIQFAWRAVGEEYDKIAGKDKSGKPFIPKNSGDDVPGAAVPGKDTRLEAWRHELQTKKDAEDGFHELSKAEEAKFWESKLELAKGNSKLYGEAYHQMREDERAAQKESLKDEETLVKERVAATKQGSLERVAILQEEVSHLKSIGADQTEDFKRTQTELAAAVRAYAEQQGKDAVEAERRKVDATRKGSEERVAAERAVLADLVTLRLTETAEYTAQLAKVNEAVRQAAEERVKLQELDIEQARIVGVAKIQIWRQNVQTEFDLHRINAQQRVALLRDLENEEYEVTKTAIEKKLALMEQDPTTSPVKIKELQNQIENLTREHNNKLAQLSTQNAKDSQAAFDNYFSRINSGFTNSLNGMLEGTRSFAQGMQQVWNSVVTGIIDRFTQMGLKWIEQHLLMRAFSALFHTQEIAEHVGTEQAKTAGTAVGATQRSLIEGFAFAKHIARSAAEVAIHIAKELAKTAATIIHVAIRDALEIAAHLRSALRHASEAAMGAFKAVMANVPFPADVILAPAAAAAAFAGVMAFASAAGGMDVTHDTLAQLHAHEVVLPAPLSLGFKDIIGRMNSQIGGEPIVHDNSTTFEGGINYSPTFNHPASPQQDPRVITKMVRRSLAKQTGGAIRR